MQNSVEESVILNVNNGTIHKGEVGEGYIHCQLAPGKRVVHDHCLFECGMKG